MANPVPSLPDLERRTVYPLSGSSGPFDVGFPIYGNGTDYYAWLEVWLDGNLLTPGDDWTFTSASGPLNIIPRPILDGQVSLSAARTGELQIVGARRPRRISQFNEGRGVPARDQNQVLTDIVATLRELFDRRSRYLSVPPGDALGELPAPADRANLSLGFDELGALMLQALPSGYPASVFMASVLASDDADEARAALGVTVSPDAGSTVAFVNWQNFR